jgi:hypothetical protein
MNGNNANEQLLLTKYRSSLFARLASKSIPRRRASRPHLRSLGPDRRRLSAAQLNGQFPSEQDGPAYRAGVLFIDAVGLMSVLYFSTGVGTEDAVGWTARRCKEVAL